MKNLDDNLLAAYLEGNLDEEDTKAVEEIIESDPELIEFIEEWVAINDSICSSLPWKEEGTPASGEIVKELIPSLRPSWKPYLIAASLLAFVSIPAILLFRNPQGSPSYGASNDTTETKAWTPVNTNDTNTVQLKDTINLTLE